MGDINWVVYFRELQKIWLAVRSFIFNKPRCQSTSHSTERGFLGNVMLIIKEVDTVGYFNQDTLGHGKELIAEHNRIVERGEWMMLLQGSRKMDWLNFQCLDIHAANAKQLLGKLAG